MTEEILTLKEVAAYLKLAEKTAYRLAAEGKLPGFKVGGSWRFKQSDIESWIETRKTSIKNNDDPQTAWKRVSTIERSRDRRSH